MVWFSSVVCDDKLALAVKRGSGSYELDIVHLHDTRDKMQSLEDATQLLRSLLTVARFGAIEDKGLSTMLPVI